MDNSVKVELFADFSKKLQTKPNRNKARQEKAAVRQAYDSDLSDAQWKLIAPLFYKERKDG